MTDVVVFKFGGSIITDKHASEPATRADILQQLAKDLAVLCNEYPLLRPLVLHGAGSFGHPLAHRYAINGKTLTPEAVQHAGEITDSVRRLNTAVVDALRQAGLSAFPVQTSVAVTEVEGSLQFVAHDVLEDVMTHGGIPVLSGDIVFADRTHIKIASADRLATLCSERFDAKTLVFATDVAGVFSSWPPAAGEQPLVHLTREEIEHFAQPTDAHAHDVTGEMQGKLAALLPLRGRRIVIGDGQEAGFLLKALTLEPRGTVIEL